MQNIQMDLLSQLGPNKVIIPINMNKFAESNSSNDLPHLFDSIEDLSSIFRGLKKIKKETSIIFNTVDYIIKAILENLDGTFGLLPTETRKQKIDKFKIDLINNVDVLRQKRSGMTKDDVKKMLDECDINICTLISNLLKKNIVIDMHIYGTYDTCIVLKKQSNNQYTIEEQDVSNDDMINRMREHYIKEYINQSILEKLNTLLLSEIRTIADNIGIPLYKIEEGKKTKKQNYLKQELKDLIKAKIEVYKQ